MGGTRSREMTALAKEIWEFALSQKITITAEYLPGKLNVKADWASRNFQDSSECLLSPKIIQLISQNWGTPDIDLFFPGIAINFTRIWLGDQILTVRQQMLSNRNGKTCDFYMLSQLSH